MKIRYAGATHVGMKRQHNEDNFFLLSEENVYIVADGMGGHASGEERRFAERPGPLALRQRPRAEDLRDDPDLPDAELLRDVSIQRVDM